MKRNVFGLAGLALFLIGLVFAYDWTGPVRGVRQSPQQAPCSQDTPTGVPIGGPFELVNQDGETVTHEDFRGKYMLIYFGFTFCPDTCPVALENMSFALEQLEPSRAQRIRPVFISVDPARDTPEAVKEYISYFHEDFVGLTGSLEQVKEAAQAYRVYFTNEAPQDASDENDYFVNHTSIIYLMDPDGNYLTHFTHSESPQKIASVLKSCVAPQ